MNIKHINTLWERGDLNQVFKAQENNPSVRDFILIFFATGVYGRPAQKNHYVLICVSMTSVGGPSLWSGLSGQ